MWWNQAEDSIGIAGPSGETAFVEDGGLKTNPRTAFEQAVLDGRAFTWAGLTKDADAHDTILGLQNSSPTDVLKIHKMIITTDNAGQVQIFTASGVTMAGTTLVVGVNLNRASGRVAQATAYTDETGNTEQGSSYPNKILTRVLADTVPTEIVFDGGIILWENRMVGIDLTTASAAGATAVIIGWFEPR